MEAIIIRYGFIAIVLGAGIEGEPFALAGGVLAHRHLMPLWGAVLAAFAGSCLIDQAWFHLARRVRTNRWVRSVQHRPAFARCLEILERHPIWFVLLFRFAYGLRAVAPVAIGMSQVKTRLFVPLNMISALVWSSLFTGLGYLAGPLFDQIWKRFAPGVEGFAIFLSVSVFLLALRRGRGGRRRPGETAP